MKHSLKTGLCFGLTSGIITTMGLMIGLESGTNSRLAVLGGILTIAIADAFSDALGIHISEESENRHSSREVWESTLSTFIMKFFMALSFAVPVFFLDLRTAINASIIWGISALCFLSYLIAKWSKKNAPNVIFEHLIIAAAVIVLANFAGNLIHQFFV